MYIQLLVIILNYALNSRSAKWSIDDLYTERKIAIFYSTNKYYSPTQRASYRRSRVTSLCGTNERGTPIHLQMVRLSFLSSVFVIKLSWGTEWYVEQEKLAAKLPRACVQSSLPWPKPQRGRGWRWKPSKRRRGRKERRRKRRCIPTQIQGTRKLGSSVSGRKEESSGAKTSACLLVVYLWYHLREYIHSIRTFSLFAIVFSLSLSLSA